MKYFWLGLMVWGALAALPGCFRDATVTGLPVADEPALEDWRNHFLGGLVRGIKTDDVKLDEVCPEGTARIETKQNGWNGLVSVLTLGIYTPTKLNVYCAAESSPTEASTIPMVEEPPSAEATPGDEAIN